jgi:hypothetical protein
MLRHAIVASAALAMISGAAVAGPIHHTTKTIHRTAHGMVVTKQHKTFTGKVVTKQKAVDNGLTGSSVTRSKTVTDPDTGASKTKTTTKTTNGE